MTDAKHQGRGWHGDSEGHAKAGARSSGKFKQGEARTRDAAISGGNASPGKFKPGEERTRNAGHRGGKASAASH